MTISPVSSPSLTLAPHSRIRVDLKAGRLGSIKQALNDDPAFFSKPWSTDPRQSSVGRSVGDMLLEDAVLLMPSPENVGVVAYLLSKSASTPALSPGLLAFAVSNSDGPVLDRLLEAGWNPLSRSEKLLSALEVSASRALPQILKKWSSFLPGDRDENGRNLLHHLCLAEFWSAGPESAMEASQILMKAGVSWDQQDNFEKFPADYCKFPSFIEAASHMWREIRATKLLSHLSKEVSKPKVAPVLRPRM